MTLDILMFLLCLHYLMRLSANFQVVFWTCFWSLSLFVFRGHNTFHVEDATRTQHFEDSLPCYCYAIKTNSGSIRSQLSQRASKERTWVDFKFKLISAWHQNSEPESFAAWVLYRQIYCHCKLLKRLIGIKLLTTSPNFQGGKSPFCPPLRTSHVSGHILACMSCNNVGIDLWKWLRVNERFKKKTGVTKYLDINNLVRKLLKQHWAPFFSLLGTML